MNFVTILTLIIALGFYGCASDDEKKPEARADAIGGAEATTTGGAEATTTETGGGVVLTPGEIEKRNIANGVGAERKPMTDQDVEAVGIAYLVCANNSFTYIQYTKDKGPNEVEACGEASCNCQIVETGKAKELQASKGGLVSFSSINRNSCENEFIALVDQNPTCTQYNGVDKQQKYYDNVIDFGNSLEKKDAGKVISI